MLFFWLESDDNFYKIGFSNKYLGKRVKYIQRYNPYPVNIIHAVSPKGSAEELEAFLLAKFDEYRVNGEWFKFDDENLVKEVIKIMNEFE